MRRQGHKGMMMPTKIRKRGCSSSSSSSSKVHNYRLNKRPIVVTKSRAELLMGSRSNTPVPTWRTSQTIGSPMFSQSGKSTQPVSARRLAATLWEQNDMSETNLGQKMKMVFNREKMHSESGLRSGSGSLPPHLLDSSHCPGVLEKIDRPGSRRGKSPSFSQKLQSRVQNVGDFDTMSNASFMEIETRSCHRTSSGSVTGGKNRLKDVSNALTTSKELLKIINRVWARADQPSSSMSLVSALHAELERARMQVNQLIQEQRLEKTEINHLMKCFAEEKASWKIKEQQVVESTIGTIAGELEVERKLRRRLERFNKKLGKELAEMKSSFLMATKELESEKRAKEITEQVCDELARNIDEDKTQAEKPKRESVQIHENVEKERHVLELADKLREEKVQMEPFDSKNPYEEKNSAISKLRKQLEVFLGTKRDKDEERATNLGSMSKIGSYRNEQEDDGEVEDVIGSEVNVEDLKRAYTRKKLPINDEVKLRNSISGQGSRRSTSIVRSVSDGVELINNRNLEKETQRRQYVNDMQRYRPVNGLKDRILSSSRLSSAGPFHSPARQRDQIVQANSSRLGSGDVRRSKWRGV